MHVCLIACVVANSFSAAADANILINTCRLAAQRYLFAYQEPIPVEQLVKTLCDNKQVRHTLVICVCVCACHADAQYCVYILSAGLHTIWRS